MTPRRKHPHLDMPADLSDESAAEILDFLHEMVRVFESRYFTQLRRHYDALRADMMDASTEHPRPATDSNTADTEPPF